jgi:hypothetical protein
LESTAKLVAWLSADHTPSHLRIPRVWPAWDEKRRRFRLGLVRGLAAQIPSGIIAHHHTGSHADGAAPALFAFLRVALNLEPNLAYTRWREAIETPHAWALLEEAWNNS